MPQNKIQYQVGLSLTKFTEQYGTDTSLLAMVRRQPQESSD